MKHTYDREADRQGARSAGVAVIDPKTWLCPVSGGCSVAVGDTSVYRCTRFVSAPRAAARTGTRLSARSALRLPDAPA